MCIRDSNDSIHKVDMPGGVILSQNPPAGSKVKENRKIYVDVTKYEADLIPLRDLMVMYGQGYERTAEGLSYQSINSEIRDYIHDSGEPDHIMQVWYDGKLIDGESGRKRDVMIKKGGTLSFTLSKSDGGPIQIPNLICRPYSQLNFILKSSGLALGAIDVPEGVAITDRNSAVVIAQDPEYAEGATMLIGSQMRVTIQQEKPESCGEQ